MNCKNCHTELSEDSDFCNRCGGKIIRNRLTFRNLFEHVSETFFNYDNRLLRTFIDLIKKPEIVIGGYIDGVRKRYVNPISFFGLILTLVGLEWFILQKFFPHLLNMSSISTSANETALKSIFDFIQKYSSVMMMLYIPLYALVSRVVFFDYKKYNYTEHIVAFVYMLSMLSLIGLIINFICVLLGYDLGAVTYFNLFFQVIYISYCFKRLYALDLGSIIGRTFLSFVVYMILYIIVIGLIILSVYLIEGKEPIIEFLKSMIKR